MTVSTEQATAKAVHQTGVSLTSRFQAILEEAEKLNTIPAYRPDLKSAKAQELIPLALSLTHESLQAVELLTGRVHELEQDIKEIWALSEKLGKWLDGKEGWDSEES